MIPTWKEAYEKVESGKADPIDFFIRYHEPADNKEEAEEFRKDLQVLIDYIEACK